MEFHALEQPDQISKKEKEDAMGAYLMMFAAIGAGLPLPIINLIASFIYYFIHKNNSRFVRFHSLQSLLSQLPTTAVNIVAVFWTIQIFVFHNSETTDQYFGYLIMMALVNLAYFIFSIVGAIKARSGNMYYFLFFGKLCYEQIYKVKDGGSPKENVNLPPSL